MRVHFPPLLCNAAIAAVATVALQSSALAQGVVSEWAQVQAPPAPSLESVNVDSTKTALLVMDFGQANCSREPRCVQDIPHVKALLDQARAHHALVVYTGFPGLSMMSDIAPQQDEPMVVGRADKFYNTNLEDILKQHGITTVVACGTAANGAELFTAFGAAARGYHVVVPVDCMPGRSAYAEQTVVWGMVNDPGLSRNAGGRPAGGPRNGAGAPGGAGGPGGRGGAPAGYATLSSSDMVHFN